MATSPVVDEFDESMKKQISYLWRVMSSVKSFKEDNTPCKIDEGLYLGSIGAAANKIALKSLNVTHILTVARRLPPMNPGDFVYKVINVADKDDVDLKQYFNQCFDFIEDAKMHGGAVLVHCLAGKSRSVTVVVAYLMNCGMSFSKALQHVRSRRPVASPNSGFILQLKELEKSLQDSFLDGINKMTCYDKIKAKLIELGRIFPIPFVGSIPDTFLAAGQGIPGASIPVSSNQHQPAHPHPTVSILRSVEVEREKTLTRDSTADLRKKRGHSEGVSYSSRVAKRVALKASSTSPIATKVDSLLEHDVNPFTIAFPPGFDYRKALDAGLTNKAVRSVLASCPEEQLIGTAYTQVCQAAAFLQVGIEGACVAKRQMEKQLAAAKKQIDLFIVERDYALAASPIAEGD